jgi:iron(III) transport system substrate-binding protein
VRAQLQHNPITGVFPTDGSVLMISGSGIMRAAPHPNAAKLFMEFMLQPKYSQVLASEGEMALRSDVKQPEGTPDITKVKVEVPTAEDLRDTLPKVLKVWRATFGL